MTIDELKNLREAEDKVEFKEAKGGNYSYNGGSKTSIKDRRKCILGYIVALANEGGGYLVFGMSDNYPHKVVGTKQSINEVGKLEQNIYNDLKIRVDIHELEDEKSDRVLLITIPGRQIGKVFKFEDVALMRVGEELLPMSEEIYRKIINETEPDFSSSICNDLSVDDLDTSAIEKMKEAYSRKQNNKTFLTHSIEQVLTDLELMVDKKLTYAALILVGKESAIRKYLPQTSISLEYRNQESTIRFDKRDLFCEAFYLMIDKLWNAINIRNGKVPIQEGPYIFDIPFFNEEVIRESLHNAITHRNYKLNGEILIKQYPNNLIISNPGGFPIGVNLKNLLTVNSTPRNRLLCEVLLKTGIVEKSGQGVDKIIYQSLKEAKETPDYCDSDDYQVTLKLSAVVKDRAFALFLKHVQKELNIKLSVKEIIELEKIRSKKLREELEISIVETLYSKGLIEKVGKSKRVKYILSKEYYKFTGQTGKYTSQIEVNEFSVLLEIREHLKKFSKSKIGDFVDIFNNRLTRSQVRYLVSKFIDQEYLTMTGTGYNTTYSLGSKSYEQDKIVSRALELGLQEMEKLGELKKEINQQGS